MYDYRRMSPEERAAVVSERKTRGWPWHSPPHFEDQEDLFHLSAACYEHREILGTPARLGEFADILVPGLDRDLDVAVHAWVVLPSHYHLLLTVNLDAFRLWIARLHNGKSTQWNREDRTPGRREWYRFSDRKIRSEGHYYASLNYIHANPVKHGYVEKANYWPWSSLPKYLEEFGPNVLDDWEKRYPVFDYGRGWDD